MGNRAAARFLAGLRDALARDSAERALARVEALHQPKTITAIAPCPAHGVRTPVTAMKECADCTKTPVLVCSHCPCPIDTWPCPTRRAIDGEAVDA